MPHPRWATEDHAAQHVGVSIYTIRRWREQGRITGYKLGHRIVRYNLNELDDMVAASDGQEATP